MSREEAFKLIEEEMEREGFTKIEGRNYTTADVIAVLFKRIQSLEEKIQI